MNLNEYWENRYKAQTKEKPWELQVFEQLKGLKGFDTSRRFLELGCGIGRMCPFFGYYVGYDISETAIEIARKLYPGKTFYAGKIQDVTWKMDIVFGITILTCIPPNEIEEVAKKIKSFAPKAFFMENPNVENGDYLFKHDYEKLFNVVEKRPFGDYTFYAIDNTTDRNL